MIRKLKKGFTLVELVVVIAVVAILSAVAIVSFATITKKAQESNDHMVIDQVNEVLVTSKILDEKPTVHEILDSLDMGKGFDIRVMDPELEGARYVYSYKDNKFGYWKNDQVVYPKELEGRTKDVDLWFFEDAVGSAGKVTFNDGASHYLNSVSEGTTKVDTDGGLDVGKQVIDEINLTRTTKSDYHVVVRTDGGTLKINAPLDTVDHYGDGEVLDISAIASDSYHEYGHFPKAAIAQGRIVVEEKGNIPAVVITAVPTSTNPVKVETSKDIVVSASPEVVAQVGSGSLENVEVKVTSAQAAVVVDGTINKDNVDAAGKSADEVVSITKVKNYSELSAAISAKKPYIMFTNNISYATNGSGLLNVDYSVTIDGNGFALSGYGNRNNNKTTLSFNNGGGTQMIDVKLSNLTIVNNGSGGRPVETRGNIRSLTLLNCNINATGSGNVQTITIGGNQSSLAKVTVKNSEIIGTNGGYAFITFNPVDLLVEDSTFNSWAALYFKAPNNSFGGRTSKVLVKGSTFVCHNVYSAPSNDFGAIVFEDGSITVKIEDSSIDITREGTNNQAAVVFSSAWAAKFGVELAECKVTFENSVLLGTINDEDVNYDASNVVLIQSGKTTIDPNSYTPDTSTVTYDGIFYDIQYRK